MTDLTKLTLKEARKKLDAREISSVELTGAYLNNIATHNPEIHAYLEVFADAEEQAKKADELLSKGESYALLGIPLAVKDNILIQGRTASGASKILENYTATYDATVISKLKKEGTVFLGRTNMDEFAFGSSTENSAYGPTKNPVDTSRVPGGSSGGSAAAVAGGLALIALGSDTGGSIRQPAALCGIVGLKPTYGSVSRHGLMAMGSSLDVIGPLAKTVDDAEMLFTAIRGWDKMDSTTVPDNRTQVGEKKKYTIGVPRSFLANGVDADVLSAFEKSLETLKNAGHAIVDIDLPTLKYALPTYYILTPAEISANLARYDGVRYGLHVDGVDRIDDYRQTRGTGFGAEVRRRVFLGTYVLSSGYYDAYYGKAMQARARIRRDVQNAFAEVDAIATPTTPSPAFKFGEKTNDPIAMYLEDVFTVSANIIGVPALSVPSGTVGREGSTLPVGFQLMAPELGEKTLFTLGTILTTNKA
jgi:aspartyl-tRNA(Asn)/glutamyl-tRNA(Gln) amidotransferase subunit A